MPAISIRNQTKGIAEMLMSFPKTPVNPQSKTMNCNLNCADLYKKLNFSKSKKLLPNPL